MTGNDSVRLQRAYQDPTPDDGHRVLVDRVWPRGRTKEQLRLDAWHRELGPSTGLRKWFGHDPVRWQEFRQRYADEIHGRPEQLDELRSCARSGRITLVFAAHDEAHNNAVVLRDVLLGRIGMPSETASL